MDNGKETEVQPQRAIVAEDSVNLCSNEENHIDDVVLTIEANVNNLLNSRYQANEDDQISPPPYSQIPGTVPLHSGRNSGPPPTYDEVINPDVPPPSYQSLFGQMREARKSADGVIDFFSKVLLIIIGTLGVTILIGLTVLIPFTMILIGASYMDQCRAENIPTFLLVGGLVWVIKNVLKFWSNCRSNPSDPEAEAEHQARFKRHESLLNCFIFGWFIAGCVLVYRIYPPDYNDPTSANYCNRTVYLYAFWLVTSTFIIFGLFMSCLCCLTISTVLSQNENNECDN